MSMKSTWRDGDRSRAVELTPLGPGRWRVRVDDSEFDLAAETLAGGRLRLSNDQGITVAEITVDSWRRCRVLCPASWSRLAIRSCRDSRWWRSKQ